MYFLTGTVQVISIFRKLKILGNLLQSSKYSLFTLPAELTGQVNVRSNIAYFMKKM